jgi:cytochrome c oxidase subunit 2
MLAFRSSTARLLSAGPLLTALAACLLLVGCGNADSTNVLDSMNTLVGHSDLTKNILDIYGLIFWIDTFLFILVQGVLIYAVIKFRARGDEKTLPEQVHGNLKMELGWTIAPVFVLMLIAIPTVSFIFESQAPADKDAIVVNATGKQWWFQFGYPGYGFETANELHVPAGRQVDLRLQSDNVIHAFWAPQLTAKRDMMPGRVNHITFTADRAGTYLGQCAEYCQDSHALMKFRVIVDSLEDFEKWAAHQKEGVPEAEAKSAGFEAFQGATCVACHAISGTSAQAAIGPNLTHVGSRTHIAAGVLENNEANMRAWLKNPDAVKPGSKMPNLNLSDEQITTLVAYLQTLK